MPPTVALAPVQPIDGDGRVGAALSHIGEAAQPTSCPDQGRLDDGSVSAIQHCTSEAASPLSTQRGPDRLPAQCPVLADTGLTAMGELHAGADDHVRGDKWQCSTLGGGSLAAPADQPECQTGTRVLTRASWSKVSLKQRSTFGRRADQRRPGDATIAKRLDVGGSACNMTGWAVIWGTSVEKKAG
jgi:hypothetical protein